MKCVEKDPHMGIGYFQLAQTYYQQQNYDKAFKSLEKARACLRGNNFIDYKQLGLLYKLYECEVGLTQTAWWHDADGLSVFSMENNQKYGTTDFKTN